MRRRSGASPQAQSAAGGVANALLLARGELAGLGLRRRRIDRPRLRETARVRHLFERTAGSLIAGDARWSPPGRFDLGGGRCEGRGRGGPIELAS
jgi:hypothetical protein